MPPVLEKMIRKEPITVQTGRSGGGGGAWRGQNPSAISRYDRKTDRPDNRDGDRSKTTEKPYESIEKGCPRKKCEIPHDVTSVHTESDCRAACTRHYELTEGSYKTKLKSARECQNLDGKCTGAATKFKARGLVLHGKMGKQQYTEMIPGDDYFTNAKYAPKYENLRDFVDIVVETEPPAYGGHHGRDWRRSGGGRHS